MQKTMKRVRSVSAMFLVLLMAVMTMATTAFASSVTFSDTSIANGQYQRFTNYDYENFTISANTIVNHDITFDQNATSVVTSGYCKTNFLGNYSYTNCLSGNNTKTIKGSFKISTAGEYKMFIYNGSANTITASSFVLTF